MASSNLITAWRSGVTSRFDSLWACLHKFAHLNGAGFSEIKATFDAQPGSRWNERARDLDRLGRLDKRKLAQAFEIPQPDIRLLISEAYNIGSKRCATLRYCPECIKKGFHTAAFQLNSIQKCPLHDLDLATKCPACRLTIAYRLGVQELSTPFGCRCGALLWPGITNHKWPCVMAQEEEDVFERLLGWVDNIKSNDQFELYGKWYSDFIHEKNMHGLACIEKIERWAPRYFGADERDVIEAEYDGTWTPTSKRSKSSFPVNVGSGAPCGCDYAFADWFNENHLKAYRLRVLAIMSSVEKSLGRHRKCADGVSIFRKATMARNGYCLLGIAYRKWIDTLSKGHWIDCEWQYRNFGRDSLDPAWSIECALITIEGQSDPMGRVLNPLVLWLALEIFKARLLCYFAFFVKETMEEMTYYHKDKLFKGKWGKLPVLNELEPVIAYYPGGVRRPRVRTYLGFSLRGLAEFSRSGVGCEL